jgi:hypothetical protein
MLHTSHRNKKALHCRNWYLVDIVVFFVRLRYVVYIENMSASSDEEELLLLYALTESQQNMKRIFLLLKFIYTRIYVGPSFFHHYLNAKNNALLLEIL